jgi:hypothetical protein
MDLVDQWKYVQADGYGVSYEDVVEIEMSGQSVSHRRWDREVMIGCG